MNAPVPDFDEDDEELAIAADLLSKEESQIEDGLDRLFRLHGPNVMRYLQKVHPGLGVDAHQEILMRTLERLPRLFRADPKRADRAILPLLLRTAWQVGREKYRQSMGVQKRDESARACLIGEALQDTDTGAIWKDLEDRSFRERVNHAIRAAADAFPPRQKQIALVLAETWELKLSEQEFIKAFLKVYGERLTRDQAKRGLDVVYEKLSEPMDRILREEGYARRS